MIGKIFRKSNDAEVATALYCRLVERARSPVFYRDLGVPDSLDGRFELIVLHLFLVLHRLKQNHPDGAHLAQTLHDYFFDDMDRSLREMGAGDLGVGKKVKRMAEAFHGRIESYDQALGAAPGGLEVALRRNLYGTMEQPAARWISAMTVYVQGASASLSALPLQAIEGGNLDFGALPGEDRAPAD